MKSTNRFLKKYMVKNKTFYMLKDTWRNRVIEVHVKRNPKQLEADYLNLDFCTNTNTTHGGDAK